MSKIHDLGDPDKIRDEAARWVWRLDQPDVSEDDFDAFQVWLDADPRHQRAYAEMAETYSDLDALAEFQEEFKLDAVKGGVLEEEGHTLRPVRHRASKFVKPILAMAAAASIAALTLSQLGPMVSPNDSTFATAVGQNRTITLVDGSTVELNTNTIVREAFSDTARTVRLDKGEAFFQVEKDRRRPFIVELEGLSVRAVGTAFNIQQPETGPIEVLVTEGVVELGGALLDELGLDQSIQLTVGDRFVGQAQATNAAIAETLAPTPIIATADTATIARQLDWRDGWIEFKGESLEDAVAELSRYTELRFIISDETLLQKQVGGVFRISRSEDWIAVLDEAWGVDVTPDGRGLVYLTRSDAAGE